MPPARDLQSDIWVAVDGLGRRLPGPDECGPPRAGKFVGIFYFLWEGTAGGPLYDNSKLVAADPEHPAYGPVNAFHWWGEPRLGYYRADDPYVLRRHAQMLADAGVDVLFMDVTNALTYDQECLALCREFMAVRATGRTTPQIAFLLNSAHEQVAQRLYDNFYAKGLYPELWFHWHGKPLMLANPEGLSPQLRDYFTLRQSWAWTDPHGWFGDGRDKWPWLDNHPQNPGWHAGREKPEELAVCTAQHPTSNIGRSFHAGRQPPPGELATERGLCFEEQWQRALEVDPELVFVTGWNEWIAQRFLSDGNMTFCGRRLPAGETFFVDQYSDEYSRDIEPMRGGHGDSYYYQLVSWVRRFKGVRQRPKAVPLRAPLPIRQDFTRRRGAGLTYLDDLGDTLHRDHLGWGEEHYVNTTGRNDFDTLQVAHDAGHVYFRAACREALTPCTDPHWMLLFLDTDGDPSNGWQGFDYVLNRSLVDRHTTVVEKCLGGWRWAPVGLAKLAVRGSQLQLAVPRAMLGLAAGPLRIDFQWADNVPDPPDILDFMDHGDTAPNGRFRYRYEG